MSLLQNEEYLIYELRSGYLSNIQDGVGERLITIDSSVFTSPAFRAAGWHSSAEIERIHSPPIPTTIASEYFQKPRLKKRSQDGKVTFDNRNPSEGLLGRQGEPDPFEGAGRAKTRHKDLGDDDQSPDNSDETDEETDTHRAEPMQFPKMPVRTRAGSSPLRPIKPSEENVLQPPRFNPDGRLRSGSIEALRQRARRDTITSSEMSSENEHDPSYYGRRHASSFMQRVHKSSQLLSERIQEDEHENDRETETATTVDVDETGVADSDGGMSLSDGDEFVGSEDLSTLLPMGNRQSIILNNSPKKYRWPEQNVPDSLPPLTPRPISILPPVSALTKALQALETTPANPLERFASLGGSGDPNPLYVKIYPFGSERADSPYEMTIKRTTMADTPITVADAIGYALWRYKEEDIKPILTGDKLDVNRWNIRMVEDGEVEDDFGARRTQLFSDYTFNNNKSRGRMARGRKPYDEFALIIATDAEYEQNKIESPQYSTTENTVEPPGSAKKADGALSMNTSMFQGPPSALAAAAAAALAPRNPDGTLLDTPQVAPARAQSRNGPQITLTVRFSDENGLARTTPVLATAETYLANVTLQASTAFGVDDSTHILRIAGTTTVAPNDRTVEALGGRLVLDLVRRRFNEGTGESTGESPNAPIIIAPGGTPRKGRRAGGMGGVFSALSSSQANSSLLRPFQGGASTSIEAGRGIPGALPGGIIPGVFPGCGPGPSRRFNVYRKTQMGFTTSWIRVLVLDSEYLHMLPSDKRQAQQNQQLLAPSGGAGGNQNLFPGGTSFVGTAGHSSSIKLITVPYSNIVGSKVSRRHPRIFRVVVFRERESKRYDFEAQNKAEAQEIVAEIQARMDKFQSGL